MITLNGVDYYTAKEFADKVGASKSYVCRLCRDGRLTAKQTQLGWLLPAHKVSIEWAHRRQK